MEPDLVFRALADPTRRQLLDMLHERAGLTLNELCEGLAMRRQSVSQHLELLAAANLVTSTREGRRKLHYLNPVPVHEIQRRWIWKFEEPRLSALDAIKRRAEAHAMSSPAVPDYVYTTYIHAAAEAVWDALTDPDLTGRYWGHAQRSDWEVGSRVDHIRVDGSGVSDATGTILEADRPRRLSFSFDDPGRIDDPSFEPSVVSFEIEPGRGIVKLTVTHRGLRTPEELSNISHGWPAVLANLKTLLETGEVLPQAPWELHTAARSEQMAGSG